MLEGPTTNAVTGKLSYLLILPSGQRVELRQLGTSNYYESADSSWFQLETNYGAQTLTLRTSNGTQLRYQPQSGVYRCNQIKDSNGNFLTVSYTSFGKLNSVTDTLGCVLNFAYDGFYHLTDITQTWAGQSHLWAHFDYANITINTNFAGGIYYVNGPANNTQIPVLSRSNTRSTLREWILGLKTQRLQIHLILLILKSQHTTLAAARQSHSVCWMGSVLIVVWIGNESRQKQRRCGCSRRDDKSAHS